MAGEMTGGADAAGEPSREAPARIVPKAIGPKVPGKTSTKTPAKIPQGELFLLDSPLHDEIRGERSLMAFSAGNRQPMGRLAAGCPPEVIDSPPPRLAAKVEQAHGQGAQFIVIDTPPHADSAARAAVEIAGLVLIPRRPSAFDLSAIQTTAKLVQLLRKPAFVVFTAGSPNAPSIYQEAGELVASFGTPACPIQIPDRAAFRHASAEGRTVMEFEPGGKAADDVRSLYT